MSDLVSQEYGLLPSGFNRMRLPEIRQQIVNELNTRMGFAFETRTDSITGQFISIFAEREATLWELAEAVYHAMYPISAFGTNLDHSVSFAGVRRLFAMRSNAWVVCYGEEGTRLQAGLIIRNQNTQDEFLLRNEIVISRRRAIDVTFAFEEIVVGNSYWVRINTVSFTHVAVEGDTPLTIAAEFADQLLATRLQVHLNANIIRLWNIESVAFQFQISTNILLTELGNYDFVDAANFGPLEVGAGNLNQIVSKVNGWERVNNLIDGHEGRDTERDDQLRLRYDLGVYRLGAATLPAIKANLQQNVVGIIAVEVFENPEDFEDDEGRPPHSIEVVAFGADPIDIAQEIFRLKAAGIDTYGDIEIMVEDTAGFQHLIKFNRPTVIYFWVKVEILLYNREQFPDNGIELMQKIVADYGNTIGIGGDVILQRFFGPIYSGVPGIQHIRILVAYSEIEPEGVSEETGSTFVVPEDDEFTDQNVMLISRQLSQFDHTRVIVLMRDSRYV